MRTVGRVDYRLHAQNRIGFRNNGTLLAYASQQHSRCIMTPPFRKHVFFVWEGLQPTQQCFITCNQNQVKTLQ